MAGQLVNRTTQDVDIVALIKEGKPVTAGLLKSIWLKSDQPCSKRLHPMLPTWLPAYSKRHKIDEESQRRILSVSPATLDRVLRDCKVDDIHKANKQTISALKQSIPIIDTPRKIDVAGHLYADTVAHCGDSTHGNFVWTLTVTDDLTLWTLNRAFLSQNADSLRSLLFWGRKMVDLPCF